MYKSALLAIKPQSNSNNVIHVAASLAKQRGWKVFARSWIDSSQIIPAEPVPIGAGTIKKERDEAVIAQARQAAEVALQSCRETFLLAGVDCHAQICVGCVVEDIPRQVQPHDLLIVGHSGGDDTGDESLLRNVLRHSARPALVVPQEPVPGEDALVAFDGSRPAARALASFVQSGLASGRSVHVISCDSDRNRANATSDIACSFLQFHGIKAQGHVEQRTGSPVSALFSHAQRLSCAILVMGAFGKPAVRDFFLGSVARSVMHELSLTLFLDH